MNRLLASIVAVLLLAPGMARSQQLPAGPIPFRFATYANNVRVLPPLVAEWQLGVSRLSGTGVISNGTVTGTFTDTDDIRGGRRPGRRSLSGKIIGGTYTENGNTRRLTLTVEITSTSHPSEECAVGLRGTLDLQDSDDRLPNGKPNDWVGLGSWTGKCNTHIHGWNNSDPGPRTEPPTGGFPNGGQWADVSIGGPNQAAKLNGVYRYSGPHGQAVSFVVLSLKGHGGHFTAVTREPYTNFGTAKDGSLWADIQGSVSTQGGRTVVTFTKTYRYFQQESVKYEGTYNPADKKITGRWYFPKSSTNGTFEISGAGALVAGAGAAGGGGIIMDPPR